MQQNPARSPPRLLERKNASRPTPQQEPPPPQSVPPTRPKLKNGEQPPKNSNTARAFPRTTGSIGKGPPPSSPQQTVQPAQGKRKQPPLGTRHSTPWTAEIPPAASTALPTAGATQRYRGQVLMELMIDAEGRLMSASIKKSGGNGFDEAALEAVRKAIFRPATHNGRPATCIVLLPIHFTLRNAS
ncbi:MAG: energy transducer TonB [Bilophila wadsworthia]